MGLLGTGSAAYAGRYSGTHRRGGGAPGAESAVCQNCLQKGHYTYQCKKEAAYKSRPTRSQQLKDPKAKTRFLDPAEIPEDLRGKAKAPEEKQLALKEGRRERKRKRRRTPSSSSSSSDSDSSTSSGSSSSSSGSSSYSSSSSGTTSTSTSGSSSSDSSSSGTPSSSSGSSDSGSSSGSSDSGGSGGRRRGRRSKDSGGRSRSKDSGGRSRKRADQYVDRDTEKYYAAGRATGRSPRAGTSSGKRSDGGSGSDAK